MIFAAEISLTHCSEIRREHRQRLWKFQSGS